ncbi:hypothetical protein NLG97_g7228 [Lecanicillium saksenae]|uniref:Uncharacterized protein n=1 Tax=Lecanicillium saksenae TaxID=468837 RepID=A0ACC1QP02_9HYPO|nr:hypothetical protein NLG97_g7228 [Lecanicillium saksenae]
MLSAFVLDLPQELRLAIFGLLAPRDVASAAGTCKGLCSMCQASAARAVCPIGLSLVAPRYLDAQLLAVAAPVGALFEAKGGWTRSVHQEQSVKLVGEGNGHREASNGLWIKGKL